MNHKTIGILCALPEEETYLVNAMEERRTECYGGIQYHVGRIHGLGAIVCCGGMGKANAASTTQVLITKYGVTAILFSGIAGNMTNKVALGDIVIGKTLCYHDATDRMLSQSPPFTAEYSADPLLLDALEQGCRLVNVHYILGKIATGDRFVDDPAAKRLIWEHCRPDCVEMEGAACAQTAMRNQVPFAVIRTMSDNSEEPVQEALGTGEAQEFLITEYAKTASAVVLAAISSLRL